MSRRINILSLRQFYPVECTRTTAMLFPRYNDTQSSKLHYFNEYLDVPYIRLEFLDLELECNRNSIFETEEESQCTSIRSCNAKGKEENNTSIRSCYKKREKSECAKRNPGACLYRNQRGSWRETHDVFWFTDGWSQNLSLVREA